jgi:Fe-S cluster biogenesis protein NfuA
MISSTKLREEVRECIYENIPQIRTHGGGFIIEQANPSEGQVKLVLTDECVQCSLAPMTKEAIENRLKENIRSIRKVDVLLNNEG